MQKCQNETKAVLKFFLLNLSTSKVSFKCKEKTVAIHLLEISCLSSWFNTSAAQTNPIQMRNEALCTIVTHNHRISYHLTKGSMLTSQDYNPTSVVYVPELIEPSSSFLH